MSDVSTYKRADQRLKKILYVDHSPIHGRGVFARQAIAKGKLIGIFLGPKTQRNGKYVLWVSDGEREEGRRGATILKYLNHSDKPNAAFDGFRLYAARAIQPDEEITFDYGDGYFDDD